MQSEPFGLLSLANTRATKRQRVNNAQNQQADRLTPSPASPAGSSQAIVAPADDQFTRRPQPKMPPPTFGLGILLEGIQALEEAEQLSGLINVGREQAPQGVSQEAGIVRDRIADSSRRSAFSPYVSNRAKALYPHRINQVQAAYDSLMNTMPHIQDAPEPMPPQTGRGTGS